MWRAYHNVVGHPGTARMLSTLQQCCYWSRMIQDVKEWTEACLQCMCAKAGPEVKAPLSLILTSYPFEAVGVDFLSLGCPDDRYPNILVMTAGTAAQALYHNLIWTFGCPERIMTDQGAAFKSTLIQGPRTICNSDSAMGRPPSLCPLARGQGNTHMYSTPQ